MEINNVFTLDRVQGKVTYGLRGRALWDVRAIDLETGNIILQVKASEHQYDDPLEWTITYLMPEPDFEIIAAIVAKLEEFRVKVERDLAWNN